MRRMVMGVLLLAVVLSGCGAIDTAQSGQLAQLEVGNVEAAGPRGLDRHGDPGGRRRHRSRHRSARNLIKVRLLGIDSPETQDSRIPMQCWGPESTKFATATLLHKRVRLVGDRTQNARDRFGRTLAYLYLPNGDNYDNYSVLATAAGAARSYVYNRRPVAEHRAITAAEADARAAGRVSGGPAPPDLPGGLPSQDQVTSDNPRPSPLVRCVAVRGRPGGRAGPRRRRRAAAARGRGSGRCRRASR